MALDPDKVRAYYEREVVGVNGVRDPNVEALIGFICVSLDVERAAFMDAFDRMAFGVVTENRLEAVLNKYGITAEQFEKSTKEVCND